MRTEQARPVRLQDYRPSDWLIDKVDLDIALHPSATRVRARLVGAAQSCAAGAAPLRLDGDELSLSSLAIDGAPLPNDAYAATPDSLTIAQPPQGAFQLEIETTIDPSANTKLMGLYRSNGTYCTQCEAEGFRRITYFLDRPDVMAVYTTRIEADARRCAGAARQRQSRRSRRPAGRTAFRGLARSASEAVLSVRAGRRRSRLRRRHASPPCPAARSR